MTAKSKLLIFALGSLLLIAAACKTSGNSSSGDGIGSSSGGVSLPGSGGNGAAAISATDQPVDVMTKAMRAQLGAKSFRAHMTSALTGGNTGKMLVEYVAPDRYHMVSEGQGGVEGRSFKMEYIIIGGTTYMKSGDGAWGKSPIDAGAMVKAFRDPKMLEELAKTADIKFVGPDTLDGAPMLVYQYSQNNPLGIQAKTTSKSWLSVADGLLRQTASEGEFNGVKSKMMVQITDYDADIKIESPIK